MRMRWASVACASALLPACGRTHQATAPVAAHAKPPARAAHSKTELEAAFRAAFGKPSPVTIGTKDVAMTFTPAGLVDVDRSAGILALVANGQNKDDCHACTGSLSVRYVKRTPAGFQPWGKADGYQFNGNGFGGPPQWKVRRDLEDNPVLAIETGFTGQGYTCAAQDLAELTPDGAVTRAYGVPVEYDDSGVGDEGGHRHITTLEGQVRPLVKGHRFEVVFHGTRSKRMLYERRGETYATRDKPPPTC